MEIFSEIAVERLRLFFPTKEAREQFLTEKGEYAFAPQNTKKFVLDIKHLENFKQKYPGYEYEIHFEKKSWNKSIPVQFSIWGAVVEKEINESQYMFDNLEKE